jgi:chromosome partitioning protein
MKKERHAKVIVFGVQKGGSCKTTSAAITAWLLSQKYKVLAVDLDAQGNLTEVISLKPIRQWRLDGQKGVLDAIKEGDPRPYILAYTDNFHLLPADELLGILGQWLYNTYKNSPDRNFAMAKMFEKIVGDYDFVIIDTAPALNELLINALTASDGVVAMYETGKFCYSALFTFHETVQYIQQEIKPELKFLGILPAMIDNRRLDNKDFLDLIRKDDVLGAYCFNTTITRKAAAARLAFAGFFDNPEIKKAVEQYEPFVKELIKRVRSA